MQVTKNQVFRSAALILSIIVLACAGQSNVNASDRKNAFQLKSRKIIIDREEISPDFYSRLQATSLPRLHAFVQLRQRPAIRTKRILENKGIRLLFHVKEQLWVASISKEFSSEDEMVRSLVGWIGQILPEDKIAPDIKQGRFHKGIYTKDRRVRLSVDFFKDVPQKEAVGILKKYTKVFEPRGVNNGWYIVASKDIIQKLADHDQVKWIEQGPFPFRPLNNFTRQATHTEEVQDLDLGSGQPVYQGLSGVGIQVGIWDDGVDSNHDDFKLHDAAGTVTGTRFLQANPIAGIHGTLVSGVVGASGYRSDACVSAPYLFRGMAPEVEFYVRRPWQNTVPTKPQFAEA
ncbi:MAG: S8 family serine peptidase, partial [Desulfobacterales bacterium]